MMKSLRYVVVFYMMLHVSDANGTTCTELSVIFQEIDGHFVPVSSNNINWEEMGKASNASIRKECTIELLCANNYTECQKSETRVNHTEIDLGEEKDEFLTSNIPTDSKKSPTTTAHTIKSKAIDAKDGNFEPYSGSGEEPFEDHTEVPSTSTICTTTIDDTTEGRTIDENDYSYSGSGEGSIGDHTDNPSTSEIFPTATDKTAERSTIDENDYSYSGSGEGSIGDHTDNPSTSEIFPTATDETAERRTIDDNDYFYTGLGKKPSGKHTDHLSSSATFTTEDYNATNLNRNVTLNETEATNTAMGLVGKKWYETEAVIITVAAACTFGLLMLGVKTVTTLMKSGTYVFPHP